MEIDSVRIVRYDFYKRKQFDYLDSCLQDLFESRTDLDPQTIAFGGEEIQNDTILYTESTEEIQYDEFESIQTFLCKDPIPQYFCHTLTIGTITDSELESIGAGDPMGSRTHRQNWVSQISSIVSKVGHSQMQSDAPTPAFLLFEPTQGSIADETFSVDDPVVVTEFIEENADRLAPYGFKPTEQISAIDDSYLITFSRENIPEMPLSVLEIRERAEPSDGETIEYWASWIGFAYRRVKSVTSILLILHWLKWRREEISDIDRELYEYNLTESHSDQLREEEQELEQLRRKWVESHSDTADEFQEMKQLVECYHSKNNNTTFDTPAGEKTNKSYFNHNVDYIQAEFDKLERTIERVETKLDRFISIIQDRIQSNTTESNLNLQSTVKNLTILLAVIAILNFAMNLCNNNMQCILDFLTQSEVVIIGFVTLSVGFILGYTHT